MTRPYDDIINLPHHVSKRHPQMPRSARAAQFAPFAALIGFGDVIKEKEALLERTADISPDGKDEIERKLREILENGGKAVIIHFSEKHDGKRRYEITDGLIKGTDEEEKALILAGGRKVKIEDIISIERKDKASRMPEEDTCLRQE